MLRSVARSYRLSPQDADDAVQATWIKLYEHIDRIRDHDAIAGWLATTIRREALRLLQTHVREVLTDDLHQSIDDHAAHGLQSHQHRDELHGTHDHGSHSPLDRSGWSRAAAAPIPHVR